MNNSNMNRMFEKRRNSRILETRGLPATNSKKYENKADMGDENTERAAAPEAAGLGSAGAAGAAAPRTTVKNAARRKRVQNRTLRARRKEGSPSNNDLLRELEAMVAKNAAASAAAENAPGKAPNAPSSNLVARLAALRGGPAAPGNRAGNLQRRLAALVGPATNAPAAVPPSPGAAPGNRAGNLQRRLAALVGPATNVPAAVPPSPGAAPGAPVGSSNVNRLRARFDALRGAPGDNGPTPVPAPVPAPVGAPDATGIAYPTGDELAKHLNVNPVPILFNVKNGQFKVSIPRAAGTKGALEICSPSLKGIRDAVTADFGRGSGPQKTSLYGKMFGRPRVTPRARRTRRSTRRSTSY